MPTTAGNKTRPTTGRKTICGICAFEHTLTGMLYIGSSIDCWKRKRKHKYMGSHFFRRASELGWENFKFHILEECEPSDRLALERDWIIASDCTYPFGFNIRKDPTAGWDHEWTDEMRELASLKSKSHFANSAVRTAQSVRIKAHYAENPHPSNRAVEQFSLSGEFITQYSSLKNAGRSVGCVRGGIGSAIRIGRPAAGFLWGYVGCAEPAAWVERARRMAASFIVLGLVRQ